MAHDLDLLFWYRYLENIQWNPNYSWNWNYCYKLELLISIYGYWYWFHWYWFHWNWRRVPLNFVKCIALIPSLGIFCRKKWTIYIIPYFRFLCTCSSNRGPSCCDVGKSENHDVRTHGNNKLPGQPLLPVQLTLLLIPINRELVIGPGDLIQYCN